MPKHKRGKASSTTVLEGRGTLQVNTWSDKARILLADDSEQTIQAAAKILTKEFEIVAFARDGEEAHGRDSSKTRAVMDILMPMTDGIRWPRPPANRSQKERKDAHQLRRASVLP